METTGKQSDRSRFCISSQIKIFSLMSDTQIMTEHFGASTYLGLFGVIILLLC